LSNPKGIESFRQQDKPAPPFEKRAILKTAGDGSEPRIFEPLFYDRVFNALLRDFSEV
jgi:hypothetical protein